MSIWLGHLSCALNLCNILSAVTRVFATGSRRQSGVSSKLSTTQMISVRANAVASEQIEKRLARPETKQNCMYFGGLLFIIYFKLFVPMLGQSGLSGMRLTSLKKRTPIPPFPCLFLPFIHSPHMSPPSAISARWMGKKEISRKKKRGTVYLDRIDDCLRFIHEKNLAGP